MSLCKGVFVSTRRICDFLIDNKISYSAINHNCAYTAQEVAEYSHVPGRQMAKVVVVWLYGELALVVVPATTVVDLTDLQRETGALDVRLADEEDFRDRFSDCPAGTVPPFGNLFGVETFLDRKLTASERLAFSAGTHRDVIVVELADYIRLAKPKLVDVAVEPPPGAPIAPTTRKSNKKRRNGSRTQSGGGLPGTDAVLQEQCGSPPIYHAGAD
jgi:Ala-tRNA(Pro) deacylase